ncbi:GreA/GreB family elongation factor [Chryseobacterium sp. A301]
MENQIQLTTGIYDAIKEHLRRRRVTQEEENRLTTELRHAKQVLRRDLPEDVVTVNKVVTIKDHTENRENDYILVSSDKAKPKKNKHSILSDIALAAVGYKVGDVIEWPFREGNRKIEILKVEDWVETFH